MIDGLWKSHGLVHTLPDLFENARPRTHENGYLLGLLYHLFVLAFLPHVAGVFGDEN